MLIDLRVCAKNSQKETVHVELNTRLPNWVSLPCALNCSYFVRAIDNYFLINLEVHGTITVECQRCLKPFLYEYDNQTILAICASEACADKLMSEYECIVTKNLSV